jgi:selenocysteine-specific elongation factor
VRCVFQTPLAVLPGDRFVVRETGRSETVGGGVVLDAHPVIAVTKAQPDGSLETYLSERGWLPVAQVRQETNWHVAPIVGEWIATNDHFQRTAHALEALIDQSPQGVDVATLQPWERLLLEMIDGVTVSHGIARRGTAFSADEERIATLVRDGGLTGADNTTLSRDAMRRLVQHNIVYEHDGIAFHADVLDGLHDVLARLWDAHPEGFTVASLRDATGLTRKFAVPLGTVLDKRGLTKRVGDLRLPGPRFTQLS